MVIHQSAEDYLETILILQEQSGSVRSIDIVNYLGFSKPSISIAMKKLRENGYIAMAEDGTITLREPGMAIASKIYDRHKTITTLFISLGISPEQAAEDACKVEHDLSNETYDHIVRFVQRFKLDHPEEAAAMDQVRLRASAAGRAEPPELDTAEPDSPGTPE